VDSGEFNLAGHDGGNTNIRPHEDKLRAQSFLLKMTVLHSRKERQRGEACGGIRDPDQKVGVDDNGNKTTKTTVYANFLIAVIRFIQSSAKAIDANLECDPAIIPGPAVPYMICA
jgi:hypothetical protein